MAGAFKGVHKHPKKKSFRARAHSNPLNDQVISVPRCPAEIDWSQQYPSLLAGSSAVKRSATVEIADVGCGFGGLLIRLSPLFPDSLILGLELRDKVTHFVSERIKAVRRQSTGGYSNIAVIRANAQKHLVNYFEKGQLTKLFFLFPDPHFKSTNHRRRIVQTTLLAEYAHVLACGGMLYTVTDVPELADWMQSKLDNHPLFERVSDTDLLHDSAAALLTEATEEGQKVARNQGKARRGVYRRLPDPS